MPPPFLARLAVAAAVLFGGLVVGVVHGALVMPRVWPLVAALVPLGVTVVCVASWAVASLFVGGARLAAGRPLAQPGESVTEPGAASERVSFAPGAAIMPWAGLATGLATGLVLALFSDDELRTVLGCSALGVTWGALLLVLVRRRLFALPL